MEGKVYILGDSFDLSNLTDIEMRRINQFHFIKYYTFMTISIILLSVGVPGNILTIIVLRQRDMKDAVFSTYIISLCVSNILVLIWCVPVTIVNAILHRDIYFTDPNFCRFFRTAACVLVSTSCWHLNLISGIRLSYLLDKNKRRSCLYDSPLKTIFAMVVVLTCIHTPLMLEWIQFKNEKGETVECYTPSTSIYSHIEVFFQGVATSMLLIIFNVWIYCLHRNMKSDLVEGSHTTTTIRKRLLYLVMISSAQYLISLIPVCIWPPNAHRFVDLSSPVGKYYEAFGNNICLLAMFTNQSCNFIVYCFFGRRFRLQFYKLIGNWTQCCPFSCVKGDSNQEFSTDVHFTLSSQAETEDITSLRYTRSLKADASKNDDIFEPHKKRSEHSRIEKAHRILVHDNDYLHDDGQTVYSSDEGSVDTFMDEKNSVRTTSATSKRTHATDKTIHRTDNMDKLSYSM